MIDSPSSGERKGMSLNVYVCKCYSVAIYKLWDSLLHCVTSVAHGEKKTERNWKVRPERVIAPYVKLFLPSRRTPEYNGTRGTLLESARTTSQG